MPRIRRAPRGRAPSAEFHDLAVTGRRMFQPAAVRPGPDQVALAQAVAALFAAGAVTDLAPYLVSLPAG